MTVFRNDGRFDRSNVEFADGRIVAYDKRHATPQMRHIDYGLGVLAPSAFDERPDGRAADLADALLTARWPAGSWRGTRCTSGSTRLARSTASRRRAPIWRRAMTAAARTLVIRLPTV